MLSFASRAFGGIALILAAVGLGGLLIYAVTRRTNEIGIRMAMGAAPGDVARMVMRDSLWLVAGGVIVGIPAALAVARLLKSSLVGVEATDPWTAAGAMGVLVVVAMLAAWVPARRAAAHRTDDGFARGMTTRDAGRPSASYCARDDLLHHILDSRPSLRWP